MTSIPSGQSIDGVPTYTIGGDPDGRFADYYPAWLDNLADDVTVEGSLLDGVVQGAEAVRSIVVTIRSLYERQEFKFAGPSATTASSRTTSLRSAASPSAVSSWSPATPPGRPSTSWRATGHAARCCSCPACWARSSPAPPMPSTTRAPCLDLHSSSRGHRAESRPRRRDHILSPAEVGLAQG